MFAADGVAATSILRITQAAGVSNGIFYHYFANKRELEDAVGDLVIKDLVRELAEAQKPQGYAERIAMGAIGTMRAVAANRELGAIMAQYLEEHNDVLQHTPLQLDDDIKDGCAAGELYADAPRPLLVRWLITTMGAAAREVLAGSDPDVVGESLAAMHLRVLGLPRRRAATIAARSGQRMRLFRVEDSE